jgi:hypothetical protein
MCISGLGINKKKYFAFAFLLFKEESGLTYYLIISLRCCALVIFNCNFCNMEFGLFD